MTTRGVGAPGVTTTAAGRVDDEGRVAVPTAVVVSSLALLRAVRALLPSAPRRA